MSERVGTQRVLAPPPPGHRRLDARTLVTRVVTLSSLRQYWGALLPLLLQAFGGPGRTALGFTPSYSMHEIITTGTGTRWLPGVRDAEFGISPQDAVAQVREHAPDVVFLTSPNNPTGTALPLATVEAVLAEAPGMVVVDEAYAEFARAGVPSALTLLPGHPRLVVTRTMSKAFAMAGLRLGYLAADAAVRDRIVAALPAHGLTAVPSDANFVLFGRFADAPAGWQAYLDRGVLVRDPAIPGWLRVTAGVDWEVDGFLAATAAVVREVKVL